MAQVPRATPGLKCPLWKKDVSKVCHECPSWMMIPTQERDGEVTEEWRCGIFTWLPILMRNVGKETARVGEASEQFRDRLIGASNVAQLITLAGERAAAVMAKLNHPPASRLTDDNESDDKA